MGYDVIEDSGIVLIGALDLSGPSYGSSGSMRLAQVGGAYNGRTMLFYDDDGPG